MNLPEKLYESFLIWRKDRDNVELHDVMQDQIIKLVGEDRVDIGKVVVELTRRKLSEEREEE